MAVHEKTPVVGQRPCTFDSNLPLSCSHCWPSWQVVVPAGLLCVLILKSDKMFWYSLLGSLTAVGGSWSSRSVRGVSALCMPSASRHDTL